MNTMTDITVAGIARTVFEATATQLERVGLEWEYSLAYLDAINYAIQHGANVEEADRLTYHCLRFDVERTVFEAVHDAFLAVQVRGSLSDAQFDLLLRPFRQIFV
jgi:hypothetical protein